MTSSNAAGHGDLLPLEACSEEYVAKYTLDGTHPATSPTARAYNGSFVVTETTVVRAIISVNGTDRPV